MFESPGITRWICVVITVLVVAAFGGRAGADPNSTPASQSNADQALFALENQWVRALVHADVGTLDDILAKNYVDTNETGYRSDKTGVLSALETHDLKLMSITLSDTLVYRYGDAAVVVGVAAQTGTFKGLPIASRIVFTDTFVLQNGAWKLAASQRTAAP